MENNKNKIIAALVALLIVGSIWGGIGNHKAKNANYALKETQTELQALKAELASEQVATPKEGAVVQPGQDEDQVALEAVLADKEQQLVATRQEVVRLHEQLKQCEQGIKERETKIAKLAAQNKAGKTKDAHAEQQASELEALAVQLQGQTADLQDQLEQKSAALAKAEQQVAELEEADQQLQSALQENGRIITELEGELAQAQGQLAEVAEAKVEGQATENETLLVMSGELESAKAQIIGLEKIVEEKDAALEETARELDRLRVNTDVLLAKISDQRDALQELQGENLELVKNLTAKNDEIASLQEQLAPMDTQNN
jgi:chromosome segregation ATPase